MQSDPRLEIRPTGITILPLSLLGLVVPIWTLAKSTCMELTSWVERALPSNRKVRKAKDRAVQPQTSSDR